jgi:hypothetical protein
MKKELPGPAEPSYETLRALDYSEHEWRRDSEGNPDFRAWTDLHGDHGGPVCACCGYGPCVRCLDNPDTCVTVEHTCGC